MRWPAHALRAALLALVTLALAGCGLPPRRIDSDVQTFTAAEPALRPALYRFERLPSQADTPSQDLIEAMASQALAKVGLTAAPLVSGALAGTAEAAPDAIYAIQVSAQVTAMVSPYNPVLGFDFWGPRGLWSRDHHGFSASLDTLWYRHAVHILMRDSKSGRVVYETSAHFDSPWSDSANLLPVVFDAALSDYPQPPQGPRKVIIELPAPPRATP